MKVQCLCPQSPRQRQESTDSPPLQLVGQTFAAPVLLADADEVKSVFVTMSFGSIPSMLTLLQCSGGSPCSRCRALETECTYAESQDGRTRALRDRSKEELDIHKKVVNGLFRVICERREHPFLDLIRNNASLEDVAAAIDEFNVDFRSESASQTPESYASNVTESLNDRATNFPFKYPREEFDLMSVDKVRNEAQFGSGEQAEIAGPSLVHVNVPSVPSIDASANATFSRHFLEPMHRRDSSILSGAYLDFRNVARQMIEQQASLSTHILGDPNVSCTALFESSASSGPFGVATWAAATLRIIVGPDILFRLAWLCYLTRFIKVCDMCQRPKSSVNRYSGLSDPAKRTSISCPWQ